MKTLNSSAFLSIVFAFFLFLGAKDYPIAILDNPVDYSFSNIVEPTPKLYSEVDFVPDTVTIEVFETFNCKRCMNFGLGTLKTLREKYKNDKKVSLQVYTIPDLNHEGENVAAIGLECAGEQDHYWEMYEALHLTTELLNQREIDLMGQEMGLEILPFRNCLKSEKYGAKIGENIAYAESKGVTKKPTIIINNYRLYGNQPLENIERVIDRIFSL